MRCKNYQTDICSLSGCQIHPIATNMQQWDATHPSPLPITILLRPYTPFHSVLSDLKAHLPSPPTYPPQMIPFSSKKLLDALKFNNNRKKKKKKKTWEFNANSKKERWLFSLYLCRCQAVFVSRINDPFVRAPGMVRTVCAHCLICLNRTSVRELLILRCAWSRNAREEDGVLLARHFLGGLPGRREQSVSDELQRYVCNQQ